MESKHAVLYRNHGRGWLVAAALVCLSLTAGAAVRFPSVVQQQRGQSITGILKSAEAASPNGVTQALMTASPGTRYLPGMGGFTMAGNYGVAPGALPGSVKAASDVAVNVAGKSVGAQVAGTISKADIAGAVVGCVGGTLVGCVASVGIPLATAYFSLSGARVNPETKELETVPMGYAYCYTAPCYTYAGVGTLQTRDPELACDSFRAEDPSYYRASPLADGRFECLTPQGVRSRVLVRVQTTPLSPTWYPITPQEVKDKLIADNANNPSPLIVPELEKAGVDWNQHWKDPTVTGPASVTGPTTITQNPDGSTTTKQSTTPLSYSGPTVTAGPSVETMIKRDTSGTEIERTTTTTTPGTEEPQSAPGEEKETPLQCDDDKYPNSLGCVELGEVEDAEIPRDEKTLTYTPETPFGGGSCPADKYFTSQMAGQSYKAWDWAQTCAYTAMYVRPLVILLATFAAFLILMPGKVET